MSAAEVPPPAEADAPSSIEVVLEIAAEPPLPAADEPLAAEVPAPPSLAASTESKESSSPQARPPDTLRLKLAQKKSSRAASDGDAGDAVLPSMDARAFLEAYELPDHIGRRVFEFIDLQAAGAISRRDYADFVEAVNESAGDDLVDLVAHLVDLNGDGRVDASDLATLLAEEHMHVKFEVIAGALGARDAADVGAFAARVAANRTATKYVHDSLVNTFSPPGEASAGEKKPRARAGHANRGGLMEYARSRPHAMLTHASALAVFLVRMLQFRYAFDANWALSVAKGAGLTVLWLLGLVYVSKLRMLAWFVSEALRPWTSHTSWHAHAGLGAATWSLVHTVAHLCRPGHPAWARAETRTTSTGALAFGCFAAIALTATSRSAAKARYRLFLYAHYLHWPVVPLMLAHCWKAPWRPLILGVLAALMAVNYLAEYSLSWTADTRHCRKVGENSSYISLHLAGRKLTEGCYYRLKAPRLALEEWHPFSLACSNATGRAEFIVKDLGAWTKALHEKLVAADDTGVAYDTPIHVRGPYYAPATRAFHERRPLLVAAGIGITPFLSIIHHKLYHYKNRETERMRYKELFEPDHDKQLDETSAPTDAHDAMEKGKTGSSMGSLRDVLSTGEAKVEKLLSKSEAKVEKIIDKMLTAGAHVGDDDRIEQLTLLWMVPDFAYIDFFLHYLTILLKLVDDMPDPPVRIKVFFTGVKKNVNLTTMISNLVVTLYYSSFSRGSLEVAIGRPDFAREIATAQPSGAYGCGSRGLMDMVAATCAAASVPFEAEEFQDETLGKLWRGFGPNDPPHASKGGHKAK